MATKKKSKNKKGSLGKLPKGVGYRVRGSDGTVRSYASPRDADGGGSPVSVSGGKSREELTTQLEGLTQQAKGLGINTAKYDAALAQNRAEGAKPFAGSKFELNYLRSNNLKQNQPYVAPAPQQQKNVGDVVGGYNAGLATQLGQYGINLGADKMFAQTSQDDLFSQILAAQDRIEQVSAEDIYNSSPEKKQMERAQKEASNYTAQLNAIVAKRDADLLRVEGQGRGIPEVIIGGQQSQIQKEAAIAALPVQAQLATAQGNLEMAKDALNTNFSLRLQDAQTRYKTQTDKLNSIFNFLNEQEKRQYDARLRQEDRMYRKEENNLQLQNQWAQRASELGLTSSMRGILSLDPTSDTFAQQLAAATSGVVKPQVAAGGGGNTNQMSDNERALMGQFRGEQIVKDYNEILSQKGTIDAYIQNGVGGPADLALVFSFMKGLDPTSVVREAEYDTAAKSGNIFQGAFARFNGYFKENGGFLPENVRNEFQNLVNQKLAVKESQYKNVVNQYSGIAERQGLDPQNVVIDYAQGGYTPPVDPAQQIFNQTVGESNGEGLMNSLTAPVKSIWNFLTGK